MPLSQDQLEEGIPGHRPHSENERVPPSQDPVEDPPSPESHRLHSVSAL